MVEESKRVRDAPNQLASLSQEIPTYEQLSKKEPNDILALWLQLYPLEEEESKEGKSKAQSEDEIL